MVTKNISVMNVIYIMLQLLKFSGFFCRLQFVNLKVLINCVSIALFFEQQSVSLTLRAI